MKKGFYLLVMLCTILAFTDNVLAQTGVRYKDFVFANVTKTTVTYSNSWSVPLNVDIYQPTGDTLSARPLIILAHGGSFVPPGNKSNDNTVNSLCTNFAKRGYVTASIDYRLDTATYTMGDSATAANTVLKAVSDGKSAIRFFRKDAYTANLYKIDTNIIFVGGNSAGAVLYMQVGYIDCAAQAGPSFQSVIEANGGLEGNSGNLGYSSRVSGVINCAGALNNPGILQHGDVPSANFQGDQDVTVPYGCGDPESGLVPVRLCGLGVIEPLYVQNGINHVSVVFPGDTHVPWSSDVNKFNKVDTTTASFLYSLLPTAPGFVTPVCVSGIKTFENEEDVKVFPNPVNNQLNVALNNFPVYQKVQLIDPTGRLIAEKNVTAQNMTFERSNLSSGIYLVRILSKDDSFSTKKVVFE